MYILKCDGDANGSAVARKSMSLKQYLKRKFPVFFQWQWEFRQKIKRGEFFKKKWLGYYDPGEKEDFKKPADYLYNIAKNLPPHTTTIVDVGCGSGRNFIPFNGKYQLRGIDIVPEHEIRWVQPFGNFSYEHITVEEFTKKLEREQPDMRHTLVLSFGTLMYISRENQTRFFGACLANGCRNFIFTEPSPLSIKHPTEHFKIPAIHFQEKDFVKKSPEIISYCLLEQGID